jgi:hypothetical protein
LYRRQILQFHGITFLRSWLYLWKLGRGNGMLFNSWDNNYRLSLRILMLLKLLVETVEFLHFFDPLAVFLLG